jgi:hypothetical protein
VVVFIRLALIATIPSMKRTFIVITFTACFLFACNRSDDTSNSSANQPGVQPSLPEAQPLAADSPSSAAPVTSGDEINPGGLPPVDRTQLPVTGIAQVNPPHGEPGHRCDIAVGAPLNAATNLKPSPANPTTLTSPQIISAPAPAPSTSAGATAPGLNPPHGEPGHDCAIPVGAPLKK